MKLHELMTNDELAKALRALTDEALARVGRQAFDGHLVGFQLRESTRDAIAKLTPIDHETAAVSLAPTQRANPQPRQPHRETQVDQILSILRNTEVSGPALGKMGFANAHSILSKLLARGIASRRKCGALWLYKLAPKKAAPK